jgi:glycylpeptide N-tetradecanoyltransferase
MTEPSPEELSEPITKLSIGTDGKEKEEGVTPPPAPGSAAGEPDLSNMSMTQIRAYIQKKNEDTLRKRQLEYLEKQRKKEEKANREHKFWNTQPVVKMEGNMEAVVNKPVNPVEDVDKVRQEPYNMPAGFVWCELDVNNETHIKELYNLLSNNYVEDDDSMFRFDYSAEFLRWALTVPEFRKEWHVGVRVEKTGKLMASITGVPARVRVRGLDREMVEINFLCVHKKLRDKRLAPVLIKEITRRVNLTGRWQAVYTAGVTIPTPVSKTRYYHRNLQVEKLIDVSFSYLPRGKRMEDHVKYLDLPEETANPLRAMEDKDVPAVTVLLNNYLQARCKLFQVFTEGEVRHLLLPRESVIESYVLEGAAGVTDFLSFYHLPSTIMKHEKYNKLTATYSYYNVANTLSAKDLMNDALILAKRSGADVFNALNVMENGEIFESLKFGQGDGELQYYVYNWECSRMDAKEVGLVLV